MPSVEKLLILGASCTTVFSCTASLLPYPLLKLVGGLGDGEGARISVSLGSMAGFSLTALHVAAASGRVEMFEILGDAALMERETGEAGFGSGLFNAGEGKDGGDALWPSTPQVPQVPRIEALDVRDEQGASPLLIAAALALHHWSEGGEGGAYSQCALHILGSAADASASSCTLTGVSLGHVIEGLENLKKNSAALQFAETLNEYSDFRLQAEKQQ